jgi:hypothetical protein
MFLTAGAIVGLAAFGGSPSLAHHSVNAQFDVTKEVSAQAVLTKLDNINPHSYWTFQVSDASGATRSWRFLSVSPGLLRRSGLTVKDDVVPGRAYTIYFNLARNGSDTGLLRGLTFDGRRVNFAADYMPPE